MTIPCRSEIHPKCGGCHQIEVEYRPEDLQIVWVCKIFSNPTWIWEERFCPEKTRHGSCLPEHFNVAKKA